MSSFLRSFLRLSSLFAFWISSSFNGFAAVDLSPIELQLASAILVPNGAHLQVLDSYSSFFYKEKINITGGLMARYSARLLSDPWLDTEVPQLQILVMAYENQESASSSFDFFSASLDFTEGSKSLISSSDHHLFYTSSVEGVEADFFKSVSPEGASFHFLERNGNLLFQASLFREDGSEHLDNAESYQQATSDHTVIETLLSTALDPVILSVGLLFPPDDPLFNSQSESASLDLSSSFELPLNGRIKMNVYVSSASGAKGSLLSSGRSLSPVPGDLHVSITEEGAVSAELYAPQYDADCAETDGWYRLESQSPLYPYEWNALEVRYGVEGFALSFNGVIEASCAVSQARSGRPLYLGDYPGDTKKEGMIGSVDGLLTEFSLLSSGQTWDALLEKQLFLDLASDDPDAEIFRFMKEEGIFMGNQGMLYPDAVLNRAEMIKILLKAFQLSDSSSSAHPFWDIPDGAWYDEYVSTAYELGIVKGYSDGSFGPAQVIVRAEFFTMLSRISGGGKSLETPYSDVKATDWFLSAASYAWTHKLIRGSTFEPWDTVTRREAAQILYQILND